MSRLTTSGMALAIALATSSTGVFAQSQLEATIENMLVEYGYDIDVEMLTQSQLTALTSIDDGDSASQIRATINSVLTPDFQAMAMQAPQLREQAGQLFSEYDVDADPNRLSVNQLAALTSVSTGEMGENQARASIHSIIGEAPDAAMIGALAEPQLAALAQVQFDEFGLDIDASTLDRGALVAVLSVDTTQLQTTEEVTAALVSAAGV